MKFEPIQNKKNYQNIIEQFVRLISEGKINPGDKLPPERVMAEKLNVSKSSLREALSVMEAIGMVEIKSGEGTIISQINLIPFAKQIIPVMLRSAEIEEEISDLRRILGKACAKKAAINSARFPNKMIKLKSILNSMKNEKDIESLTKYDAEFHKIICEMAENSVVSAFIECLETLLYNSIYLSNVAASKDSRIFKCIYDQHCTVYQALFERNEKKAGEAMEKHLKFCTNIKEKGQSLSVLDLPGNIEAVNNDLIF